MAGKTADADADLPMLIYCERKILLFRWEDQFSFQRMQKDRCSLACSSMANTASTSSTVPSAQSTHGLSTAGSTDQELLRLIGVFSGQQLNG